MPDWPVWQGGERKVVRNVRMHQGEDALRAIKVAQPKLAQVTQARLRWQVLLGEELCRLGEENLTTPRHLEQTCQPVERSGEVVPFVRMRFPGVQRHADRQWPRRVGPWLGQQRPLRGERRAKRRPDRWERGLRPVADRLEEDATMRGNGAVQQREIASDLAAHGRRVRSQRRVLPSMSVKRKVTVPVGKSAIARSRDAVCQARGRLSHAVVRLDSAIPRH